MISSQSFSFVTISSIRSAPQLSQLAPVGQFSFKSEINDTYFYSKMKRFKILDNEITKKYFRTPTWHCFNWRFTRVVQPFSCRSTIRVSFSFSGSSSGRPLISSMTSFKQLLTSLRLRSYNISSLISYEFSIYIVCIA